MGSWHKNCPVTSCFFSKKSAQKSLTGAKSVVQCSRMNNTTSVKRGRGRPVGSTSFVNVSLADLDQFVGTKSAIPVSRIWLQKMGLAIQPISPSISEVADSDSSPKVEFKITKL